MTKKKKWYCVGLVVVICLLLSAGDTRLRVQSYTYFTDALPSGARIVQLSDLHSCSYDDLVQTVVEQRPDVVLMTGDMVDDVLPQDNAWAVIAPLATQFPCYYVTGNHEVWSGDANGICQQMENLGVIVLRGTHVTLDINGGTVELFGVDDPDTGLTGEQLDAFEPMTESLSILLSHRPELYEFYGDFDLVFSGHAHGGQWRIPGVLNGLYAPGQGLFPAYAGGIYDLENGATMVVSRGLSRESSRIPRLWNRPEVVVLDVVSVNE